MACFGKPGTLALLCLLPVRPLGRLLRPPPALRHLCRSRGARPSPGPTPPARDPLRIVAASCSSPGGRPGRRTERRHGAGRALLLGPCPPRLRPRPHAVPSRTVLYSCVQFLKRVKQSEEDRLGQNGHQLPRKPRPTGLVSRVSATMSLPEGRHARRSAITPSCRMAPAQQPHVKGVSLCHASLSRGVTRSAVRA